jgi:hypothetical protein
MSKLMIQYNKYTDYDKLEKLNWDFHNPSKDGQLYIAKLKRPIYMILPKTEILEIYEEPNSGIKRLKYIIDKKKCKLFSLFCDNMDSLCVEIASVNSHKWFKRDIEKRKLVELYNRIYDDDDEPDEYGVYNTTCELRVNKMDLIDDLMLYNETEGMNLMICINGIEFYKQTFQWNISVDNVVEEMIIEDDDEDDDEEEEEEIKIAVDNENDNEELLEKDKNDLINELADNMNITNKMVNDFVKKQPESIKQNNQQNKENKNDTLSRIELESVISQKSEDIRRYILNAERARRAADMMHQKAKYLGEELQRYQTQLKYL